MPHKCKRLKKHKIKQHTPEKAFDVYDYFTDDAVYYNVHLGKYKKHCKTRKKLNDL